MRIVIAADHAGWELKQNLIPVLGDLGCDFEDLSSPRVDLDDDYPDVAAKVAMAVCEGRAERGVIVCGSGVGAAVTANKFKGVRACVCHDAHSASQGVRHDNLNVLCLGGRIVGSALAEDLLRIFLEARFTPNPRFERRLAKLAHIEHLQRS